jgi:hypothetical protein
MSGTCPLPPSPEQHSLTNWIELVVVDDINEHARTTNRFDMVRQTTPPRTVQGAFCPYNAYPDYYTPYIVTEIQSNKLKIIPVAYSDFLESKSTYFYVNKNILKNRNYLESRLWIIWQTHAGANKFGSASFPSSPVRFPRQMPSRGIIFRD